MIDQVHAPQEIVTIYSENAPVLARKTVDYAPHEMDEARQVGALLLATLEPLKPAAGLAGPQIGIGRSIFIFSGDRVHHRIAINPRYTPLADEKATGWEGCFSCILGGGPLQIAMLPRYEKIQAFYLNERGEPVEELLEGFPAKVFQHETDHLEGVVNIWHPERLDVRSFGSKGELDAFMEEVKRADAATYQKGNA